MATNRPPELSPTKALLLITNAFPFKYVSPVSFKQLPSYDDRNLYFEGELEEPQNAVVKPFVLKLSDRSLHTPELAEALSRVMVYLNRKGFTVSDCVSSRNLKYVYLASEQELLARERLPSEGEEEVYFPVRVVSYIRGELMDKVEDSYLTPQLMYSIGHYIGRMDSVLQEFHEPEVETRNIEFWDLQHFTCLKKYILQIEDEKKKEMVHTVMVAYETNVLPRLVLPSMKKGIIHGDLNGFNIILQKVGEEYKMDALIDFGDTICSYYLFELAIMLAYGIVERENNHVEIVAPMCHGFRDAFPLTKDELDCVYHSVLARLCASAVMGEYRFSLEPWNTYLLKTPTKSWKMLDLLLCIGKEKVEGLWGFWD